MTTLAVEALHDVIRFVLARVDDDDDRLKRARRAEARAGADLAPTSLESMRSLKRLQADNDAKRAIIAGAQQLIVLRDQPSEKAVRDVASQMLFALCQPYRGHVGFRAEWG